MRLPITQVDAFAAHAFTGNPAAVMPLDGWLDDAMLQAIAAENNLAETAFLVPDSSDEADYELRWFTPEVEVALCGHATLASGHVLLADDPTLKEVRFRTRQAGILSVARENSSYRMALPAYRADPRPMPDVVAALGGKADDTLWHSGRYALIVFSDAQAVRALTPDFRALRDAGDILYIATARGDGDSAGTDVISRVFAPGAGINEDPVTGSAHSVLTPYWTERLGRERFTAFQASRRGGHVGCQIDGDRAILTGQCVTTMVGEMSI